MGKKKTILENLGKVGKRKYSLGNENKCNTAVLTHLKQAPGAEERNHGWEADPCRLQRSSLVTGTSAGSDDAPTAACTPTKTTS